MFNSFENHLNKTIIISDQSLITLNCIRFDSSEVEVYTRANIENFSNIIRSEAKNLISNCIFIYKIHTRAKIFVSTSIGPQIFY